MAKYYGDLPCAKLAGVIHLTVSGTQCACGHPWRYGMTERDNGKFVNIIWRDKKAITCPKCLAYLENQDKNPQPLPVVNICS